MLLQATGISKSYGAHTILSNIWFQVQRGERIGLVGVNGAGKSTLLQILSGELSADSGDIHIAKQTTIAYLAQDSGLDSELSIWEEMLTVFTAMREAENELRQMEQQMADPEQDYESAEYAQLLRRYDELSECFRRQDGFNYETKIETVLHGMGFGTDHYHTPITNLSGGQKTRLALAKILLQEPDILMLDEPTNHLDIPTLTWLENYLHTFPGAVVVISHDRYFLDAIVQTIYEIDRTHCKKYTGNYSKFIQTKAHEAAIHLKKYEQQQAEIADMEQFIQRNIARASTTKRAQSRRKALQRMERLEAPIGDVRQAHFAFTFERPSGKDVLRVEGLTAGYEDHPPLFHDVNLHITRGEIVALIGPNGVGKSTLLKTLLGQHQPLAGTITWGANVQIGYYDQEQQTLTPTNTVLDEVWNAFPHIEEGRIRTVLGNFLFSGEDVLKKISALSGGEKARVALAKLMLENANVLIMDEPTNHLDLYSKEVLEAALLDFEGTILFISHDRYFLNKMAERIVELTPNEAHYYLGNYDDYVEKKTELSELSATKGPRDQRENDSKHGESTYEAEKKARREERNRQRKLESLTMLIEQLEAEIAALEHELTTPEVYENYERLQEKHALLASKQQEWEAHYAEWEALMS